MPKVFAAVALVLALASGREALADGNEESKGESKNESRTEFDMVPILGGNSDIGYGGGAVGALTRFPELTRPGVPWAWRVEGSVFASVSTSPNLHIPYQDEWLLLTVPGL